MACPRPSAHDRTGMRISPDSTVKVKPESFDDSAAGAALSTLDDFGAEWLSLSNIARRGQRLTDGPVGGVRNGKT